MEPTAANLLGVLAVLVFGVQLGMTVQNGFEEKGKDTTIARWVMLGFGWVILLLARLLK